MKIFHFSYHKCLTVFYARIMNNLFNRIGKYFPDSFGCYKHFNSNKDEFLRSIERYSFLSLNNHAIDLNALPTCRATHFVRDPRDLIVSGYFYHRRGVEDWANLVDPTHEDWKIVNGTIPSQLPAGYSFSRYLQESSREDGLMAELEFRKAHFNAMETWSDKQDNIMQIRYEQIIGRESEILNSILRFYQVPFYYRYFGGVLARRFASRDSQGRSAHIRDPTPGQWGHVLTPAVLDELRRRHPQLLSTLGYEDS